ncbi:hypothetical protein HL667_06265 [Bradyrhizobium sp. 83012]|uniref:Uncharacterized protein n=1 Tax=Bradyrhizobium aeschynomenes TaxID=2734909 RepID=A0ABX2C8K7_9BRAD|nr:hypothetical protein [Bradyrhizobium aeschynomenes]NPU64596.1 hypothetical protein [Bradyrhizobium aeschynomenes]
MARARVQAPELAGPVPLQPAPLPGDTFTGAPQPVADHNLANIADALSGFNSALQQFGTVAQAQQKKNAELADDMAARGLIAGNTHQDYMKMWSEGRIPNYSVPNANLLVGKVAGRYASDDIINNITQQVQSGQIDLNAKNPDGSFKYDLPTLVTQQAQQQLGPIAGSPNFQHRGFVAGMEERLLGYREQLLKQQEAIREKAFQDQLAGTAKTAFADALTKSPTPEAAVNNIRANFEALGPNLPVGQKRPLLTESLLSTLQQYASDPRYVDQIDAIRKARFTDKATGQEMPALVETGRTSAARAQQLIDLDQTITRTKDVREETLYNQQIRQATLDSMVKQDGNVAEVSQPKMVKLPSGKEVTVGQNAKAEAATQYFQWSQDEGRKNQRRWSDVTDREIKTAQLAGTDVPHLTQSITNNIQGSLSADLSTDQQAQDRVMRTYEQYRYIRSRNAGWAGQHLKLPTAADKFVTAMDVLTVGGFADDRTAMAVAQGIATQKGIHDPAGLQQKEQQIDSSVRGLAADGSWLSSITGNSTPGNVGMLQNQVAKYAKLIGQSQQISADDAVKAAKEYVKQTTLQVNGSAMVRMPQLSDDQMRKQLDKTLSTMLPDIQKRLPYKDISKGDIGLQQQPDNSIRLIDKRTWMPIMLPTADGKGGLTKGQVVIYPNQLIQMQSADDAAAMQKAQEDQRRNATDALRKAHEELDNKEQGLLRLGAKPGTGYGDFVQRRLDEINKERAKMGPRPPAPEAPEANPNVGTPPLMFSPF